MVGMAFGDGPADNLAENVRRIPPLGIEVPDEVRGELQEGLKELMGAMKKVEKDERLADVEIFYKAVAWVLRDGEFRSEKEFEVARNLLKVGMERAAALTRGEAPWTRETGLVVRGYRSAIDGSVQPYGLEIPEGYDFDGVDERRLDFWFHGRAEKVSELGFIQQRMTKAGQYPPGEAIVLHPWGAVFEREQVLRGRSIYSRRGSMRSGITGSMKTGWWCGVFRWEGQRAGSLRCTTRGCGRRRTRGRDSPRRGKFFGFFPGRGCEWCAVVSEEVVALV